MVDGFLKSLGTFSIKNKPSYQHAYAMFSLFTEVIGALFSVLTIWVVTGILVYMGIQRIIREESDIDATIMLITAGVGIVANIMYV